MTKLIHQGSFLHKRMQKFIAGLLFPSGSGDWYKNKHYGTEHDKDDMAPFWDFVSKQKKEGSQYYKEFNNLNLSLTKVESPLASGKKCMLEVLKCAPQSNDVKSGTEKHIVYFPGANTYYQACFRDISAAAKETGATVHAFNFPGTGLSSGKVNEANDLINAGLSVVTSLMKQGVHPDNIILQGDCYGAGIALEVKKQLNDQADIKVRLIMNNAFKSFKAVVCDMITNNRWLPHQLKSIVKALLEFTGWHLTPGKKYKHADPYQCHIQHINDRTLNASTLSEKVVKYQHEIKTKTTSSKKRAPVVDTCPEEYREKRDRLDQKHMVRVKESVKRDLAKKFGADKFGRVNAHFADLCELEMLDGKTSVYEGFVNDYIATSNSYIKSHPQGTIEEIEENLKNLDFLKEAHSEPISKETADEFQSVQNFVTDTKPESGNGFTP